MSFAGSLALGILLGAIYIQYAWYSREKQENSITKSRKMRALVALLGQNGATVVLNWNLDSQVAADAVQLTNATATITAVLLVAGIFVWAFGYGLVAAPVTTERWPTAFRAMSTVFFEGPKTLTTELQKLTTNIHEVSKVTLSKLNIDTEEAMLMARDLPQTCEQFSKFFRSLMGFALYGFFQHRADAHPDYCACYYKFSEEDGLFYPVAFLSGNDQYRVSRDPKLGRESFAYRAFTHGTIVTWNKATSTETPTPKAGKKMLRFICVPVPYGENVPMGSRRGVLCVDSSKSGMQFTDNYHQNILIWLSFKLAQLDQQLLLRDTEWRKA